jgi:hypothetical protein
LPLADESVSPFPPYSLQDLFESISSYTEIDIPDILLFMDDGREVRQEVLESIHARGGQAGPSTVRMTHRTKLGVIDGCSSQERLFIYLIREVSRRIPMNGQLSYMRKYDYHHN